MKTVLKVCVDGHGRHPATSLSNVYYTLWLIDSQEN